MRRDAKSLKNPLECPTCEKNPCACPSDTASDEALVNSRNDLSFFRKIEDKHLTENRHDNPQLQHEYDKRFGFVLKK